MWLDTNGNLYTNRALHLHMHSLELYVLVSWRVAFLFISSPSLTPPLSSKADTEHIPDPNFSFLVSPTALQTPQPVWGNIAFSLCWDESGGSTDIARKKEERNKERLQSLI